MNNISCNKVCCYGPGEHLVPGYYPNFAKLPLLQWGPQNCMNWCLHICRQYGIDRLHIDIGALSRTNGQQLMQATETDLCTLCGPHFGPILHKEIKNIMKNMDYKVQMTYSNTEYNTGMAQSQYADNLDSHCLRSQDSFSSYSSYPQERLHGSSMESNSTSYYSYAPQDHLYGSSNTPDILTMESPSSTNENYQYLQPGSNNANPYTSHNYHQDITNTNTNNCHQNRQSSNKSEYQLNGDLESLETECGVLLEYYDKTWDICDEIWASIGSSNSNLDLILDTLSLENDEMFDSPATVQSKTNDRRATQKSCPKLNIPAGCVEDMIKKTPGVMNRDRAPKSWEFLMRLLFNTETNPSLIKWEDESQYTFRLVQPDVIVQIWNTKSEKASPNKDNFARSLRYHYKKGVLIPVPEKQLVYRAGPKAMEYIDNLRNV